jgi:hypothetical protein
MNNRIKQLAEQAEEYAADYEFEHGGDEFDIFKKKFAELILKKCCEVLYKHEIIISQFGGVEYPEAILLPHFGVK